MDVQVAGQLGIPAYATAVMVNVTAVDVGGSRVPASVADRAGGDRLGLDIEHRRPGQTIPNAAFAPLGDGGRMTVYATFTTDIVIDISGYFTPPRRRRPVGWCR